MNILKELETDKNTMKSLIYDKEKYLIILDDIEKQIESLTISIDMKLDLLQIKD